MTKLVVIVGYTGAGKSTTAQALAYAHDWAYLEEDDFVFGMHPSSMRKREASLRDRRMGMLNLQSVLSNYLRKGHSVVVEGALVDGTMLLKDFAKMAELYDCKFVPIMLVAKEAKRRMRRRINGKYVVPKRIDARLVKKADHLKYAEQTTVIDTTNMSRKRVLTEVEKLVKAAK